jgi:hypothetical protein
MSNENELILIEEPEPEVKAELPPKKKRTMSVKQLENLALGRLKRVANAKQISIEKDATRRSPPIQKPKPMPAEVVEEPPAPKPVPKPRKQKVVYVDSESEEEQEPQIVYKKRPKPVKEAFVEPPAPVVRRLKRV